MNPVSYRRRTKQPLCPAPEITKDHKITKHGEIIQTLKTCTFSTTCHAHVLCLQKNLEVERAARVTPDKPAVREIEAGWIELSNEPKVRVGNVLLSYF